MSNRKNQPPRRLNCKSLTHTHIQFIATRALIFSFVWFVTHNNSQALQRQSVVLPGAPIPAPLEQKELPAGAVAVQIPAAASPMSRTSTVELSAEEKAAVHRVFDPNSPDFLNEINNYTDAQMEYHVDLITPERMKVFFDKGQKLPPSQRSREDSVTITFRNLFYKKNGQMRLQGVSGYMKPKQMVCVLGGTDSGITSLLMVLSGRQQGGFVTGELLVNGSPPDNLMQRRIGFIPKDDIAFPTLTVKETLEFSSRYVLCRSHSLTTSHLRRLKKLSLIYFCLLSTILTDCVSRI